MFYAPHTVPEAKEFALEERDAHQQWIDALPWTSNARPHSDHDPNRMATFSSGPRYWDRHCDRFFGR